MHPPPSAPDAHSDPANAKVRLMCSYGGHILPRPHDKSKALYYTGGDTRFVAVDRRTTAATLSALTAHLSRVLHNSRPFTLKYLLPNEGLDSLISLVTDEDLHNMLEEHDFIAASPAPSRIRLFLFPSKPRSVGSVLLDPKSESWFCDALENAKIMQRGQSADSGLPNDLMSLDFVGPPDASVEARVESSCHNGEAKQGLDLSSVSESIVLETNSSIGSTSSSISMSSLPPIGVHAEDGCSNLQSKMAKVPSLVSLESDNSVASSASLPQSHQVIAASADTRASSSTVEAESDIAESLSGIHLQKTSQVSGCQLSPQLEQKKQQQEMQCVPAFGHYMAQYPSITLPISAYHPIYQPHLHQQQHNNCQPNQPYPIYLLPVMKTQPYDMNVPYSYNFIETAATSTRSPLPPHAAMVVPPMDYRPVVEAPRAPELAAEVCSSVPAATPVASVPSDQKQQQLAGPLETLDSSGSIVTATATPANLISNEFEDTFAYSGIYKTQPPAPALSLQYQTIMKATTVVSPETPAQMHAADSVKLQVGTLQT